VALKSLQVYLRPLGIPALSAASIRWDAHIDGMRTLLVLGTVLVAGAITIGLAAVVAWLRRPPR